MKIVTKKRNQICFPLFCKVFGFVGGGGEAASLQKTGCIVFCFAFSMILWISTVFLYVFIKFVRFSIMSLSFSMIFCIVITIHRFSDFLLIFRFSVFFYCHEVSVKSEPPVDSKIVVRGSPWTAKLLSTQCRL